MTSAAFKICIFGNGGVGKTTLMRRFLTGRVDLETKMTIGLDIGMKELKIDDNEIILQIWDFAGEERFRFFLPSYSLGASGGIFMFDITNSSSLHAIEEWLTVFNPDPDNPSKKKGPILMIGGKSDLDSQRAILYEEGKLISEKYNFDGYFECSSINGENVELAFKSLTHMMMKNANLI